MIKKCMSCKKRVTNIKGSVEFLCPRCGDHKIIRCDNCRAISSKYICPGCGFEGPN